MPRNRLVPLGLLLAVTAAACNQSRPTPAVLGRSSGTPALATFQGEWDPATGKLTIETTPTLDPGGLTVYPNLQDGVPGSGPDNTLELVTEASPVPGPGTSCPGGTASFDGAITLRSFYRNQSFSNVYIELTSLTPSGYEGCNSDSAPQFGASATFGLWSYGSLGPKGGANASTRTWSFHYPSSQRFTFTGHILGELGAPVYAGGPEFDWSPSSIVMPLSTFKEHTGTGGTTLAHVVWNGTTFVDTLGHITNFQKVGAPSTTPVGLWVPGGSYAGPFPVIDTNHPLGNFYQSNSDAVDTSGTFTICAKFKPGVHAQFHPLPDPGYWDPTKILVAKGQPEPSDLTHHGWAVMQMHGEYCFHYRTTSDTGGDVMSFMTTDTTTPELFTYDYECGGRDGNVIRVGVHGIIAGPDVGETGTLTGITSMPLTIGAYPDGSEPLFDGGVYEFIIDSRAPTQDVMNEIVDEAEGRYVFSTSRSSYLPGLYVPPMVSSGTTVTGVDGGSYTAPVYGTVPLASDGTGLLAEGSVVQYTHLVVEDTSTSGFCAGVEAVADADWSTVSGGLLDYGGGSFDLTLSPLFFSSGYGTAISTMPSGWATGSGHTFKVCVTPNPSGTIVLYADGAQIGGAPVSPGASISDLRAANLQIGTGGYPLMPLSGARIGRVFICPSPDPAACN